MKRKSLVKETKDFHITRTDTHVSELPCGCQAAPVSDVCHRMVQSEAVLMLEGFTVLRTAWSFELCACSTWIPMIFFDVLKHPRVTGSEPLGQGWICCCCYCWQDMGVAWWVWLCRPCGRGRQVLRNIFEVFILRCK